MTHQCELVVDVLVDRRRLVHLHLQRIGHVLAHHAPNLTGHGRREQPRALVFGRERQDGVELFFEAHVQHLVGLVQHQMADAVQLHGLALDQVNQAARRGDDHVARRLQLANLCGDVGAAVHGHRADALLVLGKLLQLLGNLLAQFTGGRQHQGLHVVPLGVEVVEQRQSKRRRLPGACLGKADEISVAFQQKGNGLGLNVGGRLEPHLGDGLQERGGKPEGVKCVQCRPIQRTKVGHNRLTARTFLSSGPCEQDGERRFQRTPTLP